jgi:hypothetical protein
MPSPHAVHGFGPMRGVGMSAEDRVRASVSGGRLESVRVEPRLLRSEPTKVVPHVVQAVNAALEDYRARRLESANLPNIDPRALVAELRGVYEQYHVIMRESAAQMQENLAELRKDGLSPIDPPTAELGDLVDDLTALLDTIDGPGTRAADLAGEGESPRGLIRATCVRGERLAFLEVEPRVLRSSVEIDENVVAAVNAALDDLAAKLAELRAEAGADLPAIRATLRELRERNLARFGSYVQGAQAFAANIGRQR